MTWKIRIMMNELSNLVFKFFVKRVFGTLKVKKKVLGLLTLFLIDIGNEQLREIFLFIYC